jgi:hypothetical protein
MIHRIQLLPGQTLRQGGAAVSFLTISTSLRALGVRAAEGAPKIVLGKLPLNAMVTTYLGEIDFFKEEGLTIEIAPSQAGPAINQAMAAGSVVVGDTGLAPAMVAMTRGIPILAPHLGAFVTERWVRSVKEECLSKIILFGERSLRRALNEYVTHYHAERNHQGKSNVLLFRRVTQTRLEEPVRCRERLGGLLNYYHQEAA